MSVPAENLSMHKHAAPMTHKEVLSVIAGAREDRFLEPEIGKLRERCCAFVYEVMQEATIALGIGGPTVAVLRSEEATVASLCSVARQREGSVKQRRELAEALVIGVLLNSDNPDWDPLDPASGRNDSKGILLALLNMSLEK